MDKPKPHALTSASWNKLPAPDLWLQRADAQGEPVLSTAHRGRQTNVGLLKANLYMRPKLLLPQISARAASLLPDLFHLDETQGV